MKNATMIDKISPAELADLAMHADLSDPIDWGMLELKEEDVFAMIAAQVLDMIQKNPPEQQLVVAAASLTKLTVENFVLNLRLHGKG